MKYLIIFLFILSGCQSNDRLYNFVVDSTHKNKDGLLKLNNFNAVDWDKMYIIQPYSNEHLFDQTVYRYKSQVLNTGISEDDAFALMLLFKGDKLVTMTKFYTNQFSLIQIRKYSEKNVAQPYQKKDAVFRFTLEVTTHDGKQSTYTEVKPL
jgi:hypothetical protein